MKYYQIDIHPLSVYTEYELNEFINNNIDLVFEVIEISKKEYDLFMTDK